MNSHQRGIALLTDTRLASMARAATSLSVQLCELNQLRDRVRKAELLGRRSPPTNRKVSQLCRCEAGRERLPPHWQRRSTPLNQ
jgi:hypothetical protein